MCFGVVWVVVVGLLWVVVSGFQNFQVLDRTQCRILVLQSKKYKYLNIFLLIFAQESLEDLQNIIRSSSGNNWTSVT